jgi:outer membrane protein assembly factor BamA
MRVRRFIYPAILALGISLPVPGEKPTQQIGEITCKGASVFSTKDLLAIAGIKPGRHFKPETTGNAVSRIKNAYLEKGYIKVEIEVGTSPQQSSGKYEKTNLTIRIAEGPRYFVLSTEVIGNELTNHGVVMRAAGLRPGEPFNPNRIDRWLRGLNRLGRFELVKRGDIQIDEHEQEHWVHVLFHLKEKPGLRIRSR